MDEHTERETVELPELTSLTIDGKTFDVESGELIIVKEYLYAADDPIGEPSKLDETRVAIDVELGDSDAA